MVNRKVSQKAQDIRPETDGIQLQKTATGSAPSTQKQDCEAFFWGGGGRLVCHFLLEHANGRVRIWC